MYQRYESGLLMTQFRRTQFIALTLVLLVSMTSTLAHARREGRGSNLYGGFGLNRHAMTLKASGAESNFTGWGAALTGGLQLNFSGEFGSLLEAEYGRSETINTFQSTTYLEKATDTYISAKLGFYYTMFALGGGVRQNQIDVDSVQTSVSGTRTSYKGMSYFAFGQLILDSGDTFRTVVEAQYNMGNFSGLEVSDAAVGLKLVFLPF